MMRVALTGSIAMGKSTAARIFEALGVPVFDSDDTVHALYSNGGGAVSPLAEIAPDTVSSGYVDRAKLAEAIRQSPERLQRIESIVHPLVYKAREEFCEAAAASGAPFAVLDIPLLFETGRQADFDRIVVVSCPADMQRQRALARPGMTPEKFDFLLGRQVPDAEKRRLAHHVIDTSASLETTQRQIKAVVEELLQSGTRKGGQADA